MSSIRTRVSTQSAHTGVSLVARCSRAARLIVCSTIVVALGLAPLSGRSAESNGDETEQAQQAFDRGVEAYERQRFERAAELFEWAYTLEKHPLFLYNASMARSRTGQPRRIRELLWAFRSQHWTFKSLGSETGTTFQGLDIGSQVAVHAHERLEARRSSLLGRRVIDRSKQMVDRRLATSPPPVRDGRLGVTGWLGIGTATLGVGALVGAGVAYGDLGDSWDDFEREARGGSRPRYRELKRDIRRQQRWVEGLGIAGVASVIAGSGLIVWSLTGALPAQASTPGIPEISLSPSGLSARIVW